MPLSPRRKKLVLPRLQLRLVAACLGLTTLALLLQFLALTCLITQEASRLDGAGGTLADQLPGMLIVVLVLTFAGILPIAFVIGIRITFRFAGPIYRLDQHMRAIARGEDPGPLRFRERDDLHELASSINAALEARGREAATRDAA